MMHLEENDYAHTVKRRARKQHECCECRLPILPGEVYEYGTSLYDGVWSNWKLCLSCVEWADVCDIHTWVIGELSNTIAEIFDMTPWRPGGPRGPRVYYVVQA